MNASAPSRPSAIAGGYEFNEGAGYKLPEYPFVEPPELRGDSTQRHAVAIVGAGISGLTLACALAKLGVRSVLLDEDNTVAAKGASSRGICYSQKALEIFQRLGIYQRIAAKGVQWNISRTFAGEDEIFAFDLRQQSSFGLSSQPPFINIQQFYVEGYLVERIYGLGLTDLRWQSRVTGCEQHADHVALTVETPAGSYRLQADYVVDASGAHSPFHGWCDATMTTRHGDDHWSIADVRFKQPPPAERRTWVEAPFNGNRAVWQHLMADDVWRVDYQMEPHATPSEVGREDAVRKRLRQQFGADAEFEIVWSGAYAYRSQCLDRLRIGRIFFMGDAAKVVGPFGGRGGNTGVADADNLAWKLAAVLRRRAPAALLDSYHEERHEAAGQNVQASNRTARFLRPADGMERTFRNAAIGLARQYPFARQLVNTGRMTVAGSYTRSSVCDRTGGLSVPNVTFYWADGSRGTVNDLIDWAAGNMLVLVFGDMSAASAQRLHHIASAAPVRGVQVLGPEVPPQAVEHVLDPHGHLQGACHVFGHAWALLRPDGYLAATGESVDAGLIQAIEQALGLSH